MTTPAKKTSAKKLTKPLEQTGLPKRRPGRPPGGYLEKTREAAARIMAGDVKGAINTYGELDPSATPLDVLVQAMRDAYRLGGAIAAAPYAEKAAPYIHAKIANIEIRPPSVDTPDRPDPSKLGLGKLLVEFVDVVDVEAKEIDDGEDNRSSSRV